MSLAAFAQESVRRAGVLIQYAESDAEGQVRLTAFRGGLEKLGWRVGDNLQIDYRWAVSDEKRARSAAAELLALAPDVILANSTLPLRAVQQATGFSYLEVSVGGKWMNLLKEIAPRITHVACMFNPQRGPYSARISRFAQEAAQRLEVHYVATPVFEPAQIEPVITALARESNGG